MQSFKKITKNTAVESSHTFKKSKKTRKHFPITTIFFKRVI